MKGGVVLRLSLTRGDSESGKPPWHYSATSPTFSLFAIGGTVALLLVAFAVWRVR